MKRKIAAILSVCLICASALASCGDSDGSKKSKKNRSSNSEAASSEAVSASSEADEEESSDGGDEEKTTGDKEEEEGSTEATKEKATSSSEENASADPYEELEEALMGGAIIPADEAPKPSGGDIKGRWKLDVSDDAPEVVQFEFRADGKVDTIVDVSNTMYFTKDGEFYADGIKIPSSYVEYDGRTIHVKLTVEAMAESFGIAEEQVDDELLKFLDGKDLLALERVGAADKSSMDGEYKIAGGVYGAGFGTGEGLDTEAYSIFIEGETLVMKVADSLEYKTNGDTLVIEGDSAIADELGGGNVKYTVDGDSLYLFSNDSDKAAVFKRVK